MMILRATGFAFPRYAPRATVALVAGALFMLVPAQAFALDPSNVIYACVQKRSDGRGDHDDGVDHNRNDGGLVRIVDAKQVCGRNEERIWWNVVGPAGPQGPAGANGTDGATGTGGFGGDTTDGFISALTGEGQLPLLTLAGGAYLVTANVTIENSNSTNRRALCQLAVGGVPFGDAAVTVPGVENFGYGGAANVTVLGSISVAPDAQASVTAECWILDGADQTLLLKATLTAIRVGALCIQPGPAGALCMP